MLKGVKIIVPAYKKPFFNILGAQMLVKQKNNFGSEIVKIMGLQITSNK